MNYEVYGVDGDAHLGEAEREEEDRQNSFHEDRRR